MLLPIMPKRTIVGAFLVFSIEAWLEPLIVVVFLRFNARVLRGGLVTGQLVHYWLDMFWERCAPLHKHTPTVFFPRSVPPTRTRRFFWRLWQTTFCHDVCVHGKVEPVRNSILSLVSWAHFALFLAFFFKAPRGALLFVCVLLFAGSLRKTATWLDRNKNSACLFKTPCTHKNTQIGLV